MAAFARVFRPSRTVTCHFGHAKSICLNFGLAAQYGGRCNLRFDDTNPTKEEQEYVDSIKEMVKWLGFEWDGAEHYASDYFGKLFDMAKALIERGLAYVDSQSADEIRANRGTLTESGKNSPFRERPAAESLRLFEEMKQGRHADGTHVVRAKIDMRSPNMNLRDPVMYRIRHAEHHRTGSEWCIYPTYDWAHGLSDCIEGISHSICTLEFEDHRPLYDWFNQKVAAAGFFKGPAVEADRVRAPQPDLRDAQQAQADRAGRAESGRRLGRSPHADARRRAAARLHARRIPALRRAHRRVEGAPDHRVHDPRGLHARGPERDRAAAHGGARSAEARDRELSRRQGRAVELPNHPQKPDWGKRRCLSPASSGSSAKISRKPPKGLLPPLPGNEVRLRSAMS
jgi:glutaminyl-tRNA synthetase